VVPITYDSLTFFVAAILMMFIVKSDGQAKNLSNVPGATEAGFWEDFREGLGYVHKSRIFLQLVVFGLVVNFFASAFFAILAPYAKIWLHGDASTYGFISSSFALGTIAGSAAIGKINFRRYVGSLLFSGIIAFGVLLAFTGYVRTIPVALVAFLAMGVLLACVNVPINALLQTQIPGELLGRTSMVLISLITAAQPIAAAISGTLASVNSIGSVLVGSGVAIVATSLVIYPFFKELRTAEY
jgi:MFS family permease